jgi:hypothetical protein
MTWDHKERRCMVGVLAEIAQERERQIAKEGWTTSHDDNHWRGELASAAAAYAIASSSCASRKMAYEFWPWDFKWWRPTNARRNLIKAAALIVAEIERLDRASNKEM